jgi:hypothetical protein
MGKPDSWEQWRVKKPFIGLEYELIDSKVWVGLSNAAKVLYIQVLRQWDKKNNCPYYLPFGYADAKGLMSKPTYLSAMQELLKSGLLICVEATGKNRKGRYALSRVWEICEPAYCG